MIVTAQGQQKVVEDIARGIIVGYYGPRIPQGWNLCDGTNGTPDLRGCVIIGNTIISVGTPGGTEPATALTHTGFALGDHSNHSPTQPAAHATHAATQPANHSAHSPTQPAAHGTHSTAGGAHTHNSHTQASTGSPNVAGTKLQGPVTHAAGPSHDHGAHSAHSGFAVDAHSVHSGFSADAHSAHSGYAVDAHSAHSTTQAANHAYKAYALAMIMKL